MLAEQEGDEDHSAEPVEHHSTSSISQIGRHYPLILLFLVWACGYRVATGKVEGVSVISSETKNQGLGSGDLDLAETGYLIEMY